MNDINIINRLLISDYKYTYINKDNWLSIVYCIRSSNLDYLELVNNDTKNKMQMYEHIANNDLYIKELFQEQADFSKIIYLIKLGKDDSAIDIFNDLLWESKKRFITLIFNDEVYIEVK